MLRGKTDLGMSWRPLGGHLGRLATVGRHLGGLLGHLGAIWKRLGRVLERFGAVQNVITDFEPPPTCGFLDPRRPRASPLREKGQEKKQTRG